MIILNKKGQFMYAEILIEYNNKTIDKTFTYLIPSTLQDKIKVGMQVRVPFNKNLINGFVLKIKDTFFDNYNLKEIDSIVLENFVLNTELLKLGKYLKQITLCSLISAYNTMLPSSLKIEKNHDYSKYQIYIELDKSVLDIEEYLKSLRYPKQKEILNNLIKGQQILKTKDNTSTVKTLVNKGLVKEVKKQVYRINYDNAKVEIKPVLTTSQEQAVDRVNLQENQTYLLYGVTGSGKTEVYMNLIEKVINNGKKALFLVPEISLTTQMIERFYQRFASKVAIFHSGLSNGEKYDEYQKIYNGEVSIVVGTRSAVFTPLKDIGIIILDEEHSSTYKQDTTPKYNAIDIAKWRGKYNNCPVILGSATPLVTDMTLARIGTYQLISLKNRVGAAKLPVIRLVDMQEEVKNHHSVISRLLEEKIKERLNNHEQIMLLLNRRGYSTTVTCSSCGFVYKCPYCDITMTFHESGNSLRCHYCGFTKLKSSVCPECHNHSLNYMGLGTEKLVYELKKMFPKGRIVRMDVDTTSKKGAYASLIKDFASLKYDIMVGTQMISKGLDFPKVTLVGIVNADMSLNIPDYRSGEVTYELLSQVAGRAGRKTNNGEVIIQTFNPDNSYIKYVSTNDYMGFYQYEMNFRKNTIYPPYCFLVSMLISGKDLKAVERESQSIFNYLNKNVCPSTKIYGPNMASIGKINNIYRYQVIIKYRKDENLFKILQYLDNMYASNRKVNLDIDINPLKI